MLHDTLLKENRGGARHGRRCGGLKVKILITGSKGQLGRELAEILPERGHEVVALSRSELDIANPRAIDRRMEDHSPELVINAAAYTDVDGCETKEELAYRINAFGPRNLAQSCESPGCDLLHVSTNYVFDGRSDRPYEPFDQPNPISAYEEGHNFVRTMLRVARERDILKVKDDEFISPTYARDLAQGIVEVVETRLYGLYHLTNSGSCSWYEFAREIFGYAGIEVEVVPIPGSEYPLPTARPPNGVLSSLGSLRLRHWREALADYLDKENTSSQPR
jgi:dTDP-4-dehydrorhamnose reductase